MKMRFENLKRRTGASSAARQKLTRTKVDVMKRIACVGIGFALSLSLLGVTSARAQSGSDSSLGDYARQVRKNAGSTKKVFDNDNLPTGDKLSIVGPPLAAATDNAPEAKPAESGSSPASGEAKTSSEAKPGETKASGETKAPGGEVKAPGSDVKPPDGKKVEEKAPSKVAVKTAEEDEATKQAAAKQWSDKLDAQRKDIDLLARELDVLQREYQIRAAAMYADAGNRMRNEADWDKQDAQYKQQIADKQKAIEEAKQKLEDMQEEARKAGVPASARE
jgi:hypothetical protein